MLETPYRRLSKRTVEVSDSTMILYYSDNEFSADNQQERLE